METCEILGYMTRVPEIEINRAGVWYLPHHAVLQDSGLNWKLRVVFDASRQTHHGHSLNKFLMEVPSLQSDLALVLLNWRRYPFAFTANIIKIFRQIKMRFKDQNFQRVMWSSNPEEISTEYHLTTVTYGTNCAPYLRIRTLKQLTQDEGPKFPLGAECLNHQAYIDDIFTTVDELPGAI